jgi:hypothetical protein
MPSFDLAPLTLVTGIIVTWILLGVAGVLAPSNLRYVTRVLLPLGGLTALILAAVGVAGMSSDTYRARAPARFA